MTKKFQAVFLWFWSGNLKSAIGNLKWLGLSVIAFVLMLAGAVAQAQQPEKVRRIGYLNATPRTAGALEKARAEAFRQGLRELGYVEGNNILIEWRYGDGKKQEPEPGCKV